MTTRYRPRLSLAAVACLAAAANPAAADEAGFAAELSALEHEFDAANCEIAGKDERTAAFEALLEHAGEFSRHYSDRAEGLAWEGIVLSTYAGEVGAMSAMKYAKAARAALLAAERIDPESLDGGLYASLGALYSKVPGGFIGFGDDELADENFPKARAVDTGNLDTNYFYGEYLLDQGRKAEAAAALRHALMAPAVASRPLLDAGRRAEVAKLLAAIDPQDELSVRR
jgi:hypothetical protein